MCGGQRTTSGFSPHCPPCLKQNLCFILLWFLGLQMCTPTFDLTWVLEIRILTLTLGWQGLFLLSHLPDLSKWDFSICNSITPCSKLNWEEKTMTGKYSSKHAGYHLSTQRPPPQRKGLLSTVARAAWQDHVSRNVKLRQWSTWLAGPGPVFNLYH